MKCNNCGAEYEIESQDYPMRDKDSIKCSFCGYTLLKWNAGVIYSAKIISPPTIVNFQKKQLIKPKKNLTTAST